LTCHNLAAGCPTLDPPVNRGAPFLSQPCRGKRERSRTLLAGIWAQNFTYDPFGNITKANAGNATSYTAVYSPATNQVSAGVTASYDANGNQTSSTPMPIVSWNALNQAGGPVIVPEKSQRAAQAVPRSSRSLR
jgi:hypothetical protein